MQSYKKVVVVWTNHVFDHFQLFKKYINRKINEILTPP